MSDTIITVSNTADFNSAIAAANAGSLGTVEINLTANITLNALLNPIALNPNVVLTINGNGATLSGADTFRGLFVYAGTVNINNLEISHAVAKGGNGAGTSFGGGGGAGLGGGLFDAGVVTLNNVGFDHDRAIGGNGATGNGQADTSGDGGGGGMAGDASGRTGGNGYGPNGVRYGELDGKLTWGQGKSSDSNIGDETFGGGGGASVFFVHSQDGAWGGGGGAGAIFAGNTAPEGIGGFGAGNAGGAEGGGGLAAGGDVFVPEGGSLSITGGTMSNGSLTGGTGFNGGQAYGAGIFMQGTGAVHFGAGSVAGQVTTIGAVIADETGASGQSAGTGTVYIDGAGIVLLSAVNAWAGSAVLETQATSGTLDLKVINSDLSSVQFNAPGTLRIENTALAGSNRVFAPDILDFGYADVIDLPGLVFTAGAQSQYNVGTHSLVVSSGSVSDTIGFFLHQTLGPFAVRRDSTGGTEVVEALSRTADDFSQSGTSDILFRDDNSGDTGLYVMSKGVFQHWDDIGPSSNAYAIVGTGDFLGNGGQNVLYENLSSGDVGYYQINAAGSNLGWTDIGPASTAYTIVGTGDFFGTGQDEIMFRNNSGVGDTGFYALTPSGTLAGWHDIGPSSTAYSIVGVGDFNGDGTSDVLYRSASTGDTGFYQVNNGHLTSWSDIGVTSTAYSVVGVGDFLGNGTEEALFRSNATGDTGFYTAGSTWHDLGASSTAYQVVGIGNYEGDATSDILFRASGGTGDTGFYQIENGAITTWHDVGATSTLYTVHT